MLPLPNKLLCNEQYAFYIMGIEEMPLIIAIYSLCEFPKENGLHSKVCIDIPLFKQGLSLGYKRWRICRVKLNYFLRYWDMELNMHCIHGLAARFSQKINFINFISVLPYFQKLLHLWSWKNEKLPFEYWIFAQCVCDTTDCAKDTCDKHELGRDRYGFPNWLRVEGNGAMMSSTLHCCL